MILEMLMEMKDNTGNTEVMDNLEQWKRSYMKRSPMASERDKNII
jgi:hypothetical protein